MWFRADSLVFRQLPAIRLALVRLIDEVPALETALRRQAGLGLLEKYRQMVSEQAEEGDQPVAAQVLQDYWRETAKEAFGALGEAVDPLRRKVGGGLYRSAFLDGLYGAAEARRSLQHLVELVFRLEPATGLDPALAYGMLERMSAGRRAECKALAGELVATFGRRPGDMDRQLQAAAARFGLRAAEGAAPGRTLFVVPDGPGPLQYGLMLRDVHRHAYSLLHFDFVLLDRGSRLQLRDFGPRDHVGIALECLFPGHGATYGVFRSDIEMRLDIYAGFAMAQALAARLAAVFQACDEAVPG
jgi:hypothetical protein